MSNEPIDNVTFVGPVVTTPDPKLVAERDKYLAARNTLLSTAARQRKEIEALRAQRPDWHDKPTGPGLWNQGGMILDITAIEDGHFLSISCDSDRWYGPIPPDPQAKGTK